MLLCFFFVLHFYLLILLLFMFLSSLFIYCIVLYSNIAIVFFFFIIVLLLYCYILFFFFFKQKTAYEMRISDWSSDVCSSDLPPDQPDLRRAGGHLRRDGLLGGRGPSHRRGLLQNHRPQQPRGAPGAPGDGYLLHAPGGRRQPQGAAHPYLAGADPPHAGAEAADPHHRSRPHLPRRPRRHPLADVPSGRGAGDRQEEPHGPSEGHADGLLPRLLRRRRPAAALPAQLFPLQDRKSTRLNSSH